MEVGVSENPQNQQKTYFDFLFPSKSEEMTHTDSLLCSEEETPQEEISVNVTKSETWSEFFSKNKIVVGGVAALSTLVVAIPLVSLFLKKEENDQGNIQNTN